ncbi:hypothetical protein NUW58_g702 [Xylaria curta]|uniref:Uncharacterized protein n=1 Tax=Xylaria curta TaxID=42375 RepID=A0ACC1PPE9_9PEZI|nr:hypothetical protein NUW58_g702 [Xylaria curta]
MLMSHFAGAFIELKLLGPESSLSARLNDFEKLTDNQLQCGTVFLRKTHAVGVNNDSNITEIQISWEMDKESEVGPLTASDAPGYYDNLDNHANFSGSIQPFAVKYNLTLESNTGHENDISHIAQNSSTSSEMATKIHGDLHHQSGGTAPMAHWTICSSQSRSRTRRRRGVPKHCINTPVVYNYGVPRGETLFCVAIRISTRTTAIIQLSLQDLNHSALEGGVDHKANQFDVNTQTSIYHQRLFLKADCRDVFKEEGVVNHESISDQQGRPDRIKTAMNVREGSLAQKNPETSQSGSRSKPAKRRKDSEELESEQHGGQATSKGISTKRTRVSDDTGDLACPFYKMDPWKFDRCLGYKLSKMSYVKQHLLRYHYVPHCNCPIGQHPLSDKAERDSHAGFQDCQKSQYTTYVMTAGQERDIQRAAGRKITSADKWYQIWSILFPDAKKPDSPFVKGHYFAEVLSSIRAFYHTSRPYNIEETFLRVMENSNTYHEAFDGLLKKIEHQVLTQSLGLSLSFHFNSDIETDGAGSPVARRSPCTRSLSTDNKVLLSFSPILDDHNPIPIPSPSAIVGNKREALALEDSSGIPCNPEPQEFPSIRNGTDAIESYELGLGLPGTSQFHQMYLPMSYQESPLLNAKPQDMICYEDKTIDTYLMEPVFEFTY